MSLNVAIIMGRLTADPELRTTQSGLSVCKFTVACDRYSKDKGADFIRCIAWRNTADMIAKWFSKGKMIAVEGSIQVDNYEDKEGNKRTATSILVNRVNFCGDKSGDSGNSGNYGNKKAGSAQQASSSDDALGDLGDFEEILSDGEPPF